MLAGCAQTPSPERVLSRFVSSWNDTPASMDRDLMNAIESLRIQGVTRFSVSSIRRGQTLSATLNLHFDDGAILKSPISATVEGDRVRAEPSLISRQLTSWEPLIVTEFGNPVRGTLATRSGRSLTAPTQGFETAVAMMERALDNQLAGSKGRSLMAGEREIATVEAKDGGVIRTSLDDELQTKAVRTMAGRPGALVVLDPRDGGIRALVSNPHPAQPNVSPAADGHLPGSTFKIVTAVAMAKANALRPNQRLPCPGRVNLAGHVITNFEGEAAGTVTVRTAFALSCNTTFARIGAALGLQALSGAAEDLGLDSTPTYGGAPTEFTRPRSTGELATMAIGAANVTTTPVAMAGVAATVARGGLLVLPHWGDLDPPHRRIIDADDARNLLSMMEEVVESGSGKRAAIPGVKLAGKTGTAEVVGPGGQVRGNDAWFVAIAPSRAAKLVVACYLPLEGVGGREAAPLVREFLISTRASWRD